MDLYKTIQALYAEKKTVERAIALIEDLQRGVGIPLASGRGKRRGRKFMGTEERQEVSERMKKYWARKTWPATSPTVPPFPPAPTSSSSSRPLTPDGLTQPDSCATSLPGRDSTHHHPPRQSSAGNTRASTQLNEATLGAV
jgi:hypothetical protein